MKHEKSDPLDQVRQVIRLVIDKLDAEEVAAIDAKQDVAPRVMLRLDRKKKTPGLVYVSAVEGIAQMTRAELRRVHGTPMEREADGEVVDEQTIDLFARELQPRYSITRAEWGKDAKGKKIYKYVNRDDITPDEFDRQVIRMLEKRRDAYVRHINLARRWNDNRRDKVAA